jgi:hypothetical protein
LYLTFPFFFPYFSRRFLEVEWYNYQKDVMDSGALGGPVGGAGNLNPDAGDYKGF